MGSLADFMIALNTDVVSALAAGGYPALTDGAILFGSSRVAEQSRPPRIVVEPLGMAIGATDIYSRTMTSDSSERRKQNVMRAVASERFAFRVRCWGGTATSNMVADYDLARTLMHATLASLQRLAPNHGLPAKAQWASGGNVNVLGVELSLETWIDMPILDSLLPFNAATQYAPATVSPVTTDTWTDAATGGTEVGC